MMSEIAALRKKYNLHMRVERYTGDDSHQDDGKFVRE